MTLLSDPPPAHSAVPLPTAARRHRSSASPLARAVAASLAALDDVEGPVSFSVRRRIDRMLREVVDAHLDRVGEDGPDAAIPALRVACAYLAAGDLEDAYLALLTARDLLR
jgi:hypothetical protein